ncbi:MAG TPA: ATP-binding protein [Dissulfurispiraceae bacterium]|nr:ATP-binding protein [Dissulfurispiraceae bacterium]
MLNNRDDATDIVHELKRIADALAPAAAHDVFENHRAFRVLIRKGSPSIHGIRQPDPVCFEELCGIAPFIEKLCTNTEQFLQNLPCNNVLLYGSRGTGKSSSVKALLNKYGGQGLRIVEMPHETLLFLSDISDIIRLRPERFILFCDDLAYDDRDGTYRQLKAMLEGGLESKPDNILIYATSNRRHLMPEKIGDNLPRLENGELHPSDTLEEKMSLSDRFGLRLGLSTFDSDIYLEIVRNYVALNNLSIDESLLELEALRWPLAHGSYSGRTARQFVDDLRGRMQLQGL